MKSIFIQASAVFLSLFFIQCTASKQSNLNVHLFSGVDIEGKTVKLSEIRDARRIALNVYSPTCVPCYKEIPTLNYLYKEYSAGNHLKFFMVVDPYLITESPASEKEETVTAKASGIMKEEAVKRKIDLPVLIMKKPFQVVSGQNSTALITGTPETLLFKTDPLILYYNFIGAISEKEKEEEITADAKVKFFKSIAGAPK